MAASARPIRRARTARGSRERGRAHRPALAAHASRRLRARRRRNDATRRTVARAVAPATSYCSSFVMTRSGAISVFIGMFPEMKTTEPYSPEAPGEGERRAGQERGEDLGEEDAPERLEPAGAEARRGVLDLGVEAREDRLERPHREGEAEEDERDADAERREGDRDAERGERPAEPAVRGVERRQRDAGDGGREGEREVDEGVEEAPARGSGSGRGPSRGGGRGPRRRPPPRGRGGTRASSRRRRGAS